MQISEHKFEGYSWVEIKNIRFELRDVRVYKDVGTNGLNGVNRRVRHGWWESEWLGV